MEFVGALVGSTSGLNEGTATCRGNGEFGEWVVTEYVGTVDRARHGGADTTLATDQEELVGSRHLARGSAERSWLVTYRARAVAGDVLVGTIAGVICYALRFGAGEVRTVWPVLIVPVAWVLALLTVEAYRVQHLGSGSDEYRAIGRATVLAGCAVALVSYLGALELPRGVILPLAPTVLVGSMVVHWAGSAIWRRQAIWTASIASCTAPA